MANTTGDDWDETSPALSQARRAGAAEISSLRKATRQRLLKEHITPAGANVGGGHLAGSGIIYFQDAAPTTKPDGITLLAAEDKGRVWVKTAAGSGADIQGAVYVWDGAAWSRLPLVLEPVLASFHKEINSTGSGVPYSQTGLVNGNIYMCWVYGTMSTGGGPYTVSVTVNGVTHTQVIDSAIGGTPQFMLPFIVTVSGGAITISAASNVHQFQAITGVMLSLT